MIFFFLLAMLAIFVVGVAFVAIFRLIGWIVAAIIYGVRRR